MRQTYDIDKELKWLRFLKMPKNLFLIWASNQLFKVLFYFQKPHKDVSQRTFHVESRDGYQIKVNEFTPKELKSDSVILYFAGGGYMMNATHAHKKILTSMLYEIGVKAYLVHYRLAPKWPFPTAFQDALDVYQYLIEHSKDLNLDTSKIGVCGDSSGGNLSAGLCLYAADHKMKEPQFQMLVYPALDKIEKTAEKSKYKHTPMLYAAILPFISKHYYKNGLNSMEQYAYPCRHPMDKPLPPAYIEVCEFDPLHDEGVKYSTFLKKTGNDVTFNEVLGAVHGFDVVFHSNIVKRNFRKRLDFLFEQTK